jgi:predicted nucleic acid-binding protein
VIYVDASVVLADLFVEDRRPPGRLWDDTLVSSRLLTYETWTRINALGLASSHGEAAHQLLGLISMIELSPVVLGRALEPFPMPMRTLDALHLSSISHLRNQRLDAVLATYDQRLARAAEALGFPLFDINV